MRHVLLIASSLALFAAPAVAKCIVSGCSAQLCTKEGEEMMTTCEFKPEHQCYKFYATCAEQQDGSCAWQDKGGGKLSSCLENNNAPAFEEAPEDVQEDE